MVSIGHATLGDTGVTVLYAGPQGAVASVDVRGGGPGTRETDLLEPHNTVERVHAIVLSGGSAFGLAAADGVMRELATHDIGFPVFGEDRPGPRVPIIPAAVIFDLIVGEVHYPTASDGAAALRAALSDAAFAPLLEVSGTVGAGTGATAGRLRGGFGAASVTAHAPSHDYQVTAYMVANPAGEVVDAETGEPPAEDPLHEFVAGVGALAMGSTTYRWVLDHLANTGEPWPYEAPTWVFTHRDLPLAADNVTLVQGGPSDHFDAIRTAAGDRDVWMVGGGDLAAQFAEVGLLDEVVLSIAPVTLGAGRPLFPRRWDLRLTRHVQHGPFLCAWYDVVGPGRWGEDDRQPNA